ncbi:extracellular solute-binding protein [Microbacterium hominis]|uniref:Extracellular solute-binding protein n=2 Tax=Microbacterium hominis TaxID=162426 RepID=A0A7D4PXY3_9MICO|nr:extracellular solute-binding protein [Microbacterium hominis]
MHSRRARAAAITGAALLALPLAACSGGGDAGGDGGSGDEEVTISFLFDNGEQTISMVEALTEAYTAENPNVTFDLEQRPGGGEGDNIVKTRLATGEMNDMFLYNSGSLFQALGPDQTLTPLDDQEWVGRLTEDFRRVVSTDNGVYGSPIGTSMAGAVLYNIPLYEELGLEIPETWDDFIANAEAVKDAGTAAPIAQTYGDTWTSQLFVLGDFGNVLAQDPEWADEYTANNAKYVDEPALQGFENQQAAYEADLFNEDFASALYDDGVRMVATGEAAHYPMLTFAVGVLQNVYPDNLNDVGVFALPAQDAADTTLTTWQPAGLYVPNTTEGAVLDAVKDFLAFTVSAEGCELQLNAGGANGPFVIDGCALPEDVPQLVKDMQPYFDEGRTAPALEFLSPIKGPALEQITVEVGSGIRSAEDGAALYDEDVEKQAQQLGLEGW